MNNYCVITTINKPTKAVEALYEKFGERLIVVLDEKSPPNWNYRAAQFFPAYNLKENALYAPYNHYARKNLGYLAAMHNKADLIYDTDDDNIPNKEWGLRFKETKASKSFGEGWFNAYEPMTTNKIWPRGFPLNKINSGKYSFGAKESVISSIQQGLSDGEPDVDAIYRMVFNRKQTFGFDRSIYLEKNTWCPFNSQSTWWFPDAYPLMYLPVNCSFRMTDIWRSFIAQRCLWEIGQGVTFHSPSEVYQERNEHDLMKDFKDEVPGYLYNEEIVSILGKLKLESCHGLVTSNLYTCYRALVAEGLLPKDELNSVSKWIEDYENITRNL
jgi:hypothetical protein